MLKNRCLRYILSEQPYTQNIMQNKSLLVNHALTGGVVYANTYIHACVYVTDRSSARTRLLQAMTGASTYSYGIEDEDGTVVQQQRMALEVLERSRHS